MNYSVLFALSIIAVHSFCPFPDSLKCPDGGLISRDLSSCKFPLCRGMQIYFGNGKCLTIDRSRLWNKYSGKLPAEYEYEEGAKAQILDCGTGQNHSNQLFFYDPNHEWFIVDFDTDRRGQFCLDVASAFYDRDQMGIGLRYCDDPFFSDHICRAEYHHCRTHCRTEYELTQLKRSNQWGIFEAVFGLLLMINIVCMTYYWCNGCKKQKHKYRSVKFVDTEDEEMRT